MRRYRKIYYWLMLVGLNVWANFIFANVIINEISATSNDRLLRWVDDVPRLGFNTPWYAPDFDDSKWDSGNAPIGAGHSGLGTNLSSSGAGDVFSIYCRQFVHVSSSLANSGANLTLAIDYDDGFILFINGKEVVRHNLGPRNMYIYHDQSVFNARSGGSVENIIIGRASEFLEIGENTIAVQVQKDSPSVNVKLKMEMKVGSSRVLNYGSEWKYFLGYVEPYGGIYDEALFGDDDIELEYEDWIELYNSGDESVDLTNWSISDGDNDRAPWVFPAGAEIEPGGYLVLFADGLDRKSGGNYYHLDFKLSDTGEELIVFDDSGTIVTQLLDYPDQKVFYSYGRSVSGGGNVYFENPTPGAPNGGVELGGITKPVKFSYPGGFHDSPITLELISNTEGALIRYTTDGSEPTLTNGFEYTAPFDINQVDHITGTVIRAQAYADGMLPSKIKTRTYLVQQHALMKHLPVMSIVADGPRAIYKPFGVAAIEGGHYPGSEREPHWAPQSVNDYNMPDEHGRSVERVVSLEMRFSDGREGFQIDAGMRIGGSNHARPRYWFDDLERSPWDHTEWKNKPSFNLYFRGDYGGDLETSDLFPYSHVTKIEKFRLRAGRNRPALTPFIRDELVRRLYIQMGHLGSTGTFVNLYVNGEYKGYYNPAELLKEQYMQELYGTSNGFDIWQTTEWQSGSSSVYNELRDRLAENLEVKSNFEAVEELLDIDAVADYYLIQLYTTAIDWPNKNYVFARERAPGKKFSFYPWDNEASFGSSFVDDDWIARKLKNSTDKRPLVHIWKELIDSTAFQMRFADRVQKHMFTPNGALSDAHIRSQVDELKAIIAPLIPFVTPGEKFNDNLFNTFLADRKNYIFNNDHFTKYGLWPEIEVPNFSQFGGLVPNGYELRLSTNSPQSGTYYYTLDGEDPMAFGGGVSASALVYSNANLPELESSGKVIARIRYNGEWSARNEADFIVGTLATAGNLTVSEIMYHPASRSAAEIDAGFTSDSQFEFIELMNVGSVSIELANVRFSSGINFDFNTSSITSLAPREQLLLVADRAAFVYRYGEGHPVAGEFTLNLSNGGERLELVGNDDVLILDFEYKDGNGNSWPADADGSGYSLVLDNPMTDALEDPASWRPSTSLGGDPGKVEEIAVDTWRLEQFEEEELGDPEISADEADPDGDGVVNLLEYALVSNPGEASHDVLPKASIQQYNVNGTISSFLSLSYRFRPGAMDVTYIVEVSSDLREWRSAGETDLVSVSNNGDGSISRTVRCVLPVEGEVQYIRLNVSR